MTIIELSKAAGVSTATVSRMLNDNGFVSKEARAKINAAIKANRFCLESRIKKGASKQKRSTSSKKKLNFTMLWTLGLENSMLGTAQNMMLGITEALRSVGANLIVDYIDSDHLTPKCLTEKDCDGIFLHGGPLSEQNAELIKDIPSVWLLQNGGIRYGDRVQPDHRNIGAQAYNHLVEQGCKNVCCIGDAWDSFPPLYSHSRAEGFLESARFGKVKYHDIKTKCSADLDYQEYLKSAAVYVVDQIEKLTPRPDGIFIANEIGLYINAELKHRNIIPMKDIYMIAGDDDFCGQRLDPDTAVIDIQGRQIGKLAAEAMLLRLKNPDMDQIKYYTKAKIVTPS